MDDYINTAGPGGGGVIDPEVRAHVYSLVTALGGASASEDGRYVLGDDALACLKDIKRWLKLHDEKLNRLDVTRCLAEAHLVKGDLLEIMGQWPEEAMDQKWRGRIALACIELLVPLTWPPEKDLMSEVTRNQHRHLPYIQVAQVTYKREVLEHPSGDILKKAVRLMLPALMVPGHERTPRDEGIIKLVLYFVRNMAMISAPPNLPVEWNEQEVGRSATIRAFDQQQVFEMLLTMASNVATDFKTQDVVILEVLFHLIKGVDPKKLFMSKPQRSVAAAGELKDLMSKETDLLKNFAKHAPTRHNRFGTMVWIERNESKMSSVSGQDILRDGQQTLDKMDKSKKWNKPKRRPAHEKNNYMTFDLPEALTDDANARLRAFVENFLDSGFNPLFANLRKAIEREADRVLIAHSQQFWYLISWFLRAESERRRARKEGHEQQHGKGTFVEYDTFGIVASVLNQETFILLNRYMQNMLDHKEWLELDAGMRCFTQILLTIQEMAESPLDEDQEIADNIQNNIFYEETTHDRVLSILRSYKDQNFSYLDATTELAHVFLRLLERYSKENGDLQIRSRRKARRKKKEERKPGDEQQTNNANNDANDGNEDEGSEAEDEAQATRISRERKFDFNRFAHKFVTQQSVNTFVRFVSYYRDLSVDQLKRAHRFFYRVAFKQEMTVLLFRLDIVTLFNRMIKGSDAPLHCSNPMFGEWTELVKQVFRRLVKKMQQRPELAVEMLFSKIPATCHYLEYGYEKQTISTTPRAPAELEVRGGLNKEEQIGVAVAALLAEEKTDMVNWVSNTLKAAAGERQSWEDLDAARAAEAHAATEVVASSNTDAADGSPAPHVPATVPATAEAPSIKINPDSSARKLAMFKDNKLRLLLKLAGAVREGAKDDPEAPWFLSSSLTASKLFDTVSVIEQHKADPRMTYGELEGDPIPAADMLKRVPASRPTRGNAGGGGTTGIFGDGDDDEGLDAFLDDGDESLFPIGGPTPRRSDVLEELKSKRRRRNKNADEDDDGEDDGEIDPAVLAARRRARQMRELEKRRKIKSTEFVHESDDDSDVERDAEFFAREKDMATKRAADHDRAFEREKQKLLRGEDGARKQKKRKRAAPALGSDDDGSDNDGNIAPTSGRASGSRAKRLRSSDDEGLSDSATDHDTAMSDNNDDSGDGSGTDAAQTSDEEGLFVSDRRSKKSKSKRKSNTQRSRPRRGRTSQPTLPTRDSSPAASSPASANESNTAQIRNTGIPDPDATSDLDSDAEPTPLSSQSEPRPEKLSLALAETDGNKGRNADDFAGPGKGQVSVGVAALDITGGDDGDRGDDGDEEEQGGMSTTAAARRRGRAMMVLDDSDDE